MNNPDKPIELPDDASVDQVFEAYDLKIPEEACDCIHCRSRAINDAICHGLIPAKHVLNKFNLVIKCHVRERRPTEDELRFITQCSVDFDVKKSLAMTFAEGDGTHVLTVIEMFANRAWVKKHTDRFPPQFTVQFR